MPRRRRGRGGGGHQPARLSAVCLDANVCIILLIDFFLLHLFIYFLLKKRAHWASPAKQSSGPRKETACFSFSFVL